MKKVNKMVRKKIRHNERFNFRMDSKVKEALQELSEMYDLSAAAYLRFIILREKEITKDTPNLHKKLLSLMRKEVVGSV